MSKIILYQQLFIEPILYSEDEICILLKQVLSDKRYHHVQRVYNTAMKLTQKFNLSDQEIQAVKKAVWFHDIAKGMSDQELYIYAQQYHIELNSVPEPVYHAIIGAWMAQHFFHESNQMVLDAIYYHTTGHPTFCTNQIGAILFLSDYIEPGKTVDCSHITKYIPHQMPQALYAVVKGKLISVIQRDRVIATESLLLYHALLKILD